MFDWQTFLAIAIVAGSAAYVARSIWSTLHGKRKGCGSSCSGCDANKQEPATFQISSEPRRS